MFLRRLLFLITFPFVFFFVFLGFLWIAFLGLVVLPIYWLFYGDSEKIDRIMTDYNPPYEIVTRYSNWVNGKSHDS